MKKSEVIFGLRAALEALQSGQEIEKIIVQRGLSSPLVKKLIGDAHRRHIPLSFVPRQRFNALAGKNHQGVACICAAVRYADLDDLISLSYQEKRDPFFLLLDHITDVGNLGAVARTAEGAGLDALVVTVRKSAPITGDAVKSSAGALSHLSVCRTPNLRQTVKRLQESGLKVVACSEHAQKTLYETDLKGPLALVVGSEKDGITEPVLSGSDIQARIPLYGKLSSLNVSVAAGIALYEAVRQRHHTSE